MALPSTIADLHVWLEANTVVAANGDPIPTWEDASGGNRDASQSNGDAYEPKLATNATPTGEPALRFGGLEYFDMPDLSALTAGSLFIVVKIDADPPAASVTGLWHFGTSGQSAVYPWTDGLIYESAGSTHRRAGVDPGVSLAEWHVYEVRTSATSWRVLLDGVEIQSDNQSVLGASVAFPALPYIGAAAFGAAHLDGDVAAFVMYSRALNDTEAGTVRSYLTDTFIEAPAGGDLLLWEPPDFHIAYAGYVDVHIGDLTTWPTVGLDLSTNYRIICDSPMHRDAVILGGRNLVGIGFESAISRAGDPAGTLASGIASAATSSVTTPVTLTAPGIADVAVGQQYVIDPFSATLAETVSVTAVTSPTSFTVQRNTGVWTGLSGDNGGGLGGPAHSGGATIKRSKQVSDGYGLFLKDWSGDAHFEGLLFSGDGVQQCIVVHTELVESSLTLENVEGAATGMDLRNFHDAHPDGMQLSLGPNELRLDKVTLTTDSNGLQWSFYDDAYSGTPWQGPPTWRVNRTNIKGTATARHLFFSHSWDERLAGYGPSPIHDFTDVYLQPPAARVGNTIYAAYIEGLNVNVPDMTELTPPATPPGGDFADAVVQDGIDYVSPGYVVPEEPPAEETTAMTVQAAGVFPAGASVEIYPQLALIPDHAPATDPVETVAASGTGALPLTQVVADQWYVAYALVGSQHRYVRFRANPS